MLEKDAALARPTGTTGVSPLSDEVMEAVKRLSANTQTYNPTQNEDF